MIAGTDAPDAGSAATSWRRVLAVVAPALGAIGVRVLGRTLRVQFAGVAGMRPFWEARRPLIYVIWHGRMLMAPWINARLRRTDRARRVTGLASRSRDGELVARYAARFDIGLVRGSSSRGGASAVRLLASAVRGGDDVVIVPDGPRGPARRLRPGVVALAAMTGAPVVPLGFGARPARTLGTWDQFVIPLPFARASFVFGAPITVPDEADRDAAGMIIEQALDEATALADVLAARASRAPGIAGEPR